MDKLRIKGGHRLAGSVDISGAKNAALPELCAALLTADTVTLHNVPGLQDVATMLKLIRNMGVEAERSASVPGTVTLNASPLSSPEAPYELRRRAHSRRTESTRAEADKSGEQPSSLAMLRRRDGERSGSSRGHTSDPRRNRCRPRTSLGSGRMRSYRIAGHGGSLSRRGNPGSDR